MPKDHNNPTDRELNDQMFREMAKAGVLKVVGHKMEDEKLAAVYRAVPPDELSEEARAFMAWNEEETHRQIAEHQALGERPRLDRN